MLRPHKHDVRWEVAFVIDSAAVDPFVLVVLAGLAVLVACLWALGTADDGRTDPLGLRSARQIAEEREALEAQELGQLLAATNARRRAQGLPERTEDEALRELWS